MPALVGPQTLAVGVATSVIDPSQRGGNPSAAVQIQNSSAYQLQVIAAGESLSIQPFFAQTVTITDTPITVTPLAATGTGTCNVTFAFLLGVAANTGVQLPDGTWVETPPQQDGTLTAQALAAILGTVTSQGAVDRVVNNVAYNLAANTVTFNVAAASKNYDSLTVFVNPSSGATPLYAVVDVWTTAIQSNPIATGSAFSGANPYQAIVPLANQQSTGVVVSFSVTVYFNGTVGAGNVTVLALTNGSTLCPLMRADGRAYPVGIFRASNSIGASGTVAIVAAPAGAVRVLVKHIYLNNSTAAGTVGVDVTVNGSTGHLVNLRGVGNASQDWESGILCDAATAVNLVSVGGGIGDAGVIYDLVA